MARATAASVPPLGAISESRTLALVIDSLQNAAASISTRKYRSAQDAIAQAVEVLGDLRGQAKEGVHKNPPLAIFFNPPKKKDIISNDVQAIVYRHAKDGEFYCHAFGTPEFGLVSRGNKLTIEGLVSRTGVQAISSDPRHVTLCHRDGKNIVEDC